MGEPGDEFSVATFNLHAGVDGWGRPFDVVGACRDIDADVLVLQEVWEPAGGPSTLDALAVALGSTPTWHPMAEGRRGLPDPRATEAWMRSGDYRTASNSLFIDSERRLSRRVRQSSRYVESEVGAWGLGVLTRLEGARSSVVALGRLPADRAQRAVVVLDLEIGGTAVMVGGTHMSHLTSGSLLQYRRLHRALAARLDGRPGVLAGDMNLWGPPLGVLLPRWRRAVRGRTWPAWRPHSQVDHVLVHGGLAVRAGGVLADRGSDHRAVRAALGVPPR